MQCDKHNFKGQNWIFLLVLLPQIQNWIFLLVLLPQMLSVHTNENFQIFVFQSKQLKQFKVWLISLFAIDHTQHLLQVCFLKFFAQILNHSVQPNCSSSRAILDVVQPMHFSGTRNEELLTKNNVFDLTTLLDGNLQVSSVHDLQNC